MVHFQPELGQLRTNCSLTYTPHGFFRNSPKPTRNPFMLNPKAEQRRNPHREHAAGLLRGFRRSLGYLLGAASKVCACVHTEKSVSTRFHIYIYIRTYMYVYMFLSSDCKDIYKIRSQRALVRPGWCNQLAGGQGMRLQGLEWGGICFGDRNSEAAQEQD